MRDTTETATESLQRRRLLRYCSVAGASALAGCKDIGGIGDIPDVLPTDSKGDSRDGSTHNNRIYVAEFIDHDLSNYREDPGAEDEVLIVPTVRDAVSQINRNTNSDVEVIALNAIPLGDETDIERARNAGSPKEFLEIILRHAAQNRLLRWDANWIEFPPGSHLIVTNAYPEGCSISEPGVSSPAAKFDKQYEIDAPYDIDATIDLLNRVAGNSARNTSFVRSNASLSIIENGEAYHGTTLNSVHLRRPSSPPTPNVCGIFPNWELEMQIWQAVGHVFGCLHTDGGYLTRQIDDEEVITHISPMATGHCYDINGHRDTPTNWYDDPFFLPAGMTKDEGDWVIKLPGSKLSKPDKKLLKQLLGTEEIPEEIPVDTKCFNFEGGNNKYNPSQVAHHGFDTDDPTKKFATLKEEHKKQYTKNVLEIIDRAASTPYKTPDLQDTHLLGEETCNLLLKEPTATATPDATSTPSSTVVSCETANKPLTVTRNDQRARITGTPDTVTAGARITVTAIVEATAPSGRRNTTYAVIGLSDGTVLSAKEMRTTGSGRITISATIPDDIGDRNVVWTFIPVRSKPKARKSFQTKPQLREQPAGVVILKCR